MSIRLNCKRTAAAVAANRGFGGAVYCAGSFGPEVRVTLGALEGVNRPFVAAAPVHDNAPLILGYEYNLATATGNGYYDIQANTGATIDIKGRGPVVATSCTANGSYTMNLPGYGSGLLPGHRLFIGDFTPSFVAGGAVLRIPASNFRGGKGVLLPPGYGFMELVFEGWSNWSVVKPPPDYVKTQAWDPGSVANAATVTTTVAMVGVIVGDEVAVGFSNDLQGLLLTGYVSAAGTVTVVLANLTGGAVDLASGTLTVTVRG